MEQSSKLCLKRQLKLNQGDIMAITSMHVKLGIRREMTGFEMTCHGQLRSARRAFKISHLVVFYFLKREVPQNWAVETSESVFNFK